jgi:rhamnosyltransferase subunit A
MQKRILSFVTALSSQRKKMEPEPLLVKAPGGFTIYVEHYRVNPAFETVILVNGALATTTSFNQTVKYLRDHFNVVLYDLPYAGQSKPHNQNSALLTKDDEVEILSHLIGRFEPSHLISISWGGVAALLALARSPKSVKRAVIGSFSPKLNAAMLDYLDKGAQYLETNDQSAASALLNNTVGKYLPRLLKLYNYRYLSTLAEHEYVQIAFHMQQIRQLDAQRYVDRFSSINIPVLFVNGELDEYTTAADIGELSQYIRNARFVTVPGTGHFLDLEGKKAWHEVRRITNGFLLDADAAAERSGGDSLADTVRAFLPALAAN